MKIEIIMTVFLGLCCSQAMAVVKNSPVAVYDFTGNANDSSGNQLHGIVSGATLTSDRFGNESSAYLFDGFDDKIEIVNRNGIFNFTSSWSISVWVKPFEASSHWGENPIVSKRNYGTTEDCYGLAWGCALENIQLENVFKAKTERASDDLDFVVHSNSHLPNKWYHVVGTYDNNSLKIYVNGTLENSSIIGPIIPYQGSTPLTIGRLNNHWTEDSSFNGIIDDVRIYESALTDHEVFELYNIPEPCSLGLLCLGGLVCLKRRQK